jgi:pyruvate/2-oxoglutarate dehydrogenase complex dihydrolipoamide dehydrogenase (E3) component
LPRFDNNLIVIGAGSAGLISAYIAAIVRARVTLVERGAMGGDCLNTGCVPSKTLIQSAKVAHTLRTADGYGMASVEPAVDFAAVMARVKAAVATIEPKDSVARYTELGVNCVAGDAKLQDPHHVAVGDQVLSTRSLVLATGAVPVVPPIPGLADVLPLTSDNLWDLQALPERLLVLGGGPIGCELAQSFARLGSRVTLIDMEERLLPREDPEVSRHMTAVFEREGMDVRLGHRATRCEPAEGGAPEGSGTLVAETASGPTSIPFDRVLVALGRRPDTRGLGLENLGVEVGPSGTLVVDDYLRTAVPNVFACGDLVGPYQFTHMAAHQAWYAAVNALFGRFWKFRVNYAVVPWATYTDPEVARVGLSVTEARDAGVPHEVTTYLLDDLDRAIADGHTEGWITVLTVPGKDRILGATIVGSQAGELIGEFILAMTHGLGLKKLMATIHIYPTRSEAAKLAAGTWRRKHAPEALLRLVGGVHGLLR